MLFRSILWISAIAFVLGATKTLSVVGDEPQSVIGGMVAHALVAPLMGVFLLIIAAVLGALALLLIDARLMVIPGVLLAGGGYWLWRRERRQAAEEAERLAE